MAIMPIEQRMLWATVLLSGLCLQATLRRAYFDELV
jgi:hypothetical protein